MFAFACIAIMEIVCVEFNLGFHLLPASCARIIVTLSYAYIASWFFYALAVFLPEVRDKRHRTPVVYSRLLYLINTIEGMRLDLEEFSEIKDLHLRDNLIKAINVIKDGYSAKNMEEYFKFLREHSQRLIEQIFILAPFLDAQALRDVNNIDRLLLKVYFPKDKSEWQLLGENFFELFSKVNQLHTREKMKLKKAHKEIRGNKHEQI